jgi:hypothetical protein
MINIIERTGTKYIFDEQYTDAHLSQQKDLFMMTQEQSLEVYVKRYNKKRLENIYKSDLGHSPFLEEIFYWDEFKKNKKDSLGHFFR